MAKILVIQMWGNLNFIQSNPEAKKKLASNVGTVQEKGHMYTWFVFDLPERIR